MKTGFVLLLSFALAAPGATVFMSNSGSHTSPFDTPEKAATNLNAAIQAAGPFGIVNIADGIYFSNSTPLTNGVSLHGQSKSGTILDGGSITRVITITEPYGGVVSNLTLRNGFADGGNGAAAYINGNTTSYFFNCLIYSNWAKTLYGGAVYSAGLNIQFRNCLLYANKASSADGGSYHGGGAFCLNTASGVATIDASTVIGNYSGRVGYYGVGGGIYRLAGRITVLNSIVVSNRSASSIGSDVYGGNTVINSILQSFAATTNINCITNAAPAFVDYGSWTSATNFSPGDYHLLPESPCIDSGTNQAWMAAGKDLYGSPRIANGIVDMGCSEYIPESPSDGAFLRVRATLLLDALLSEAR